MRIQALTCLLLITMTLAAVPPTDAARKDERAAGGAASPQDTARWQQLLGASVPPQRVAALAGALTAADGADLAARFAARPEGGHVAEDVSVRVVLPDTQQLVVEHARIVLEPAADGRTLRFDITGAPFGSASRVHAQGTIEWGAGPLGGDKLTGNLELVDADVAAVRAAFPRRIDPSFTGTATLRIQADGVIGEATTEESPATPLKGKAGGSIGWSLLGRTSPMEFTTDFSLDDRMLRVSAGKMTWQGQSLDVKGSIGRALTDEFRLTGTFAKVDVAKVSQEWNVPEPWRAAAILDGKIDFYGKPGESFIAYAATADDIVVPGLEGWSIRTGKAKIDGRLAAINGVITGSVKPARLQVGPYDLGGTTFGVRWFREQLQATIANSSLWDADAVVSASYRPAEHPRVEFGGTIGPIKFVELTPRLVPHLALDVEGTGEATFRSGREQTGESYFLGRAGIRNARWGTDNLFTQAVAALAAAEPSLAVADPAAEVPQHKSGRGTPADRLLFAFRRSGSEYEIGNVLIRSAAVQIEAGGNMTPAGDLRLQGNLYLPPAFADARKQSAPWISALRVGGDAGMFIPVIIEGTAAAPVLHLAPEYVQLLTQAKNGQAVQAPTNAPVKQITDDRMPPLGIDIE